MDGRDLILAETMVAKAQRGKVHPHIDGEEVKIAGKMAARMILLNGTPRYCIIRNAAEPMIGGMIMPPVEATDSTAPANSGEKPTFFIIGMVNTPVVATLAAELPLMVPIKPLEMTATFLKAAGACTGDTVGSVIEKFCNAA